MQKNIKSTLLILSISSFAVLLASQMPTDAFADVPSPKKQTKIGIDQTDVICKASLVKVYRINADSVDCFTPASAQKLLDAGLAKEIPKDRLEAKKSFKQNPPIGTVNSLATVKQFGEEGKLSSKSRITEYVHVFEVCANDKTIRAPEVLVRSDSEAKTVKLAQKIMANKCYTSSAKVKATDPGSISVSLTNKGAISDRLAELEADIVDKQQRLAAMKKNLSVMTGGSDNKKISENTNSIVSLRAELNLAKAELNKYLFALYTPPQLKSIDFTKPKLTLTGAPLKDTTSNIISVTKQTEGTKDQGVKVVEQNLYNVVFEACTGNMVVRAPELKMTSDVEEKTVKVSERIIANSCQMSTAKINAVDPKSITTELANRSDISENITVLEKKIDNLTSEQTKHQMELNKLIALPEKPTDYEQKIAELSSKIIQLRNEITNAKFQLHGSVYEVYKK